MLRVKVLIIVGVWLKWRSCLLLGKWVLIKKKFNYKLMKFLKYIWKIGLLYFWKINWFCIYKEWSVDVIYVDSYCLDKLNEVLNNF